LTARILGSLSILLAFAAPGTTSGNPVQWRVEDDGNGHFYEAVFVGTFTTWDIARALAEARGGQLASITSAEENAFVYELIRNRPELWSHTAINNALGPWIGGVQSPDGIEPNQGWGWLSGELFEYQNWFAFGTPDGEPNEGEGGESDYLHFFMGNGPEGPFWNDISQGAWDIRGFVVEIEPPPPPPCPDVSGDGLVNFIDITSILTNWGTSSAYGDANGDGTVNFADITAVLTTWGMVCP